jgi:hypothetical protein
VVRTGLQALLDQIEEEESEDDEEVDQLLCKFIKVNPFASKTYKKRKSKYSTKQVPAAEAEPCL